MEVLPFIAVVVISMWPLMVVSEMIKVNQWIAYPVDKALSNWVQQKLMKFKNVEQREQDTALRELLLLRRTFHVTNLSRVKRGDVSQLPRVIQHAQRELSRQKRRNGGMIMELNGNVDDVQTRVKRSNRDGSSRAEHTDQTRLSQENQIDYFRELSRVKRGE